MSKSFVSCKGKTACQENESLCRTCGRSLEEIYGTRKLVDELVQFTQKMAYENSDMFLEYVANKAAKKIHYLKEVEDKATAVNYEYH